MATENIKSTILITPKLDSKGTSNFARDLKKFETQQKKNLKLSTLNVQEINKISSAAGQFSKKLGSEFKDSVKELKKLGDELKDAQDKASDLSDAYAGAKGADKGKLSGQLSEQLKLVKGLNEQIKNQKKNLGKQTKDVGVFNKLVEKRDKFMAKNNAMLKSTANYSPTDALKDFFGSITKGDVKGALGAVGKGAAGAHVRGAEAVGGEAGDASMVKFAEAAGAMGAAVGVIGVLVKLLMAASSHMTDLNKALLQGSTLAGDLGSSSDEYAASIKSISKSAQDAHGHLIKFGLDSEKTMQIIGAYARTSTGSITQTESAMKRMGTDGASGVEEFAKNAKVYGMALGMEAQDVASMMGNFVSEIGKSSDNVMSTMAGIVKMAATSGMPTEKFMDIFRQVIPNVDLFTNRIEELTGTMKLLGKSMDPRKLSQFINTMSKGFDNMDVEQRIKMSLVLGDVPGRLTEDFKDQAASIGKEMMGTAGKEFQDAINKGDWKRAQRAITDAQASGKEGSVIDAAQELLRNAKNLKKGGTLNTATAMRGAGMGARMQMLEDYAGKFTGGELSGIGEVVAKSLGVSEDEYKAIIALKSTMGTYADSVERTGLTGSESMNVELEKIWQSSDEGVKAMKEAQTTGKDAHVMFKNSMKDRAKKHPEQLEKLLKKAATNSAQDSKFVAESASDLATEQITATMSIGDKMESVIGVWLEKLYGLTQRILDAIDGIWKYSTSGDDVAKMAAFDKENDKRRAADDASNVAIHEKNAAKAAGYTKEQTASLNSMLSVMEQAAQAKPEDAAGILKPFMDKLTKIERINLNSIEDPKKRNQMIGAMMAAQAKNKNFKWDVKAENVKQKESDRKAEFDANQKKSDKPKDQQYYADLAATAAGGPVAPGTSPATATGGPVAPGTSPATAVPAQKEAAAVAQNQAGHAEEAVKVQEQIAVAASANQETSQSIEDKIRKSLILDKKFDSTFENVLKKATLHSFRTALFEFAILQAKLDDDPEMKKFFEENSGDVSKLGAAGMQGSMMDDTAGAIRRGLGGNYAAGLAQMPTSPTPPNASTLGAAAGNGGGNSGGNKTVHNTWNVQATQVDGNKVINAAAAKDKAP